MTILRNDRIIIDRGSAVDIPVCVIHPPKAPWKCPKKYDIAEGDVLTLRIFRTTRSLEPIAEYAAEAGSDTIKIEAHDTEWMRVGRYYANIFIEREPGVRKQIWPVEVPDQFGQVHRRYNFIVTNGEEVYA